MNAELFLSRVLLGVEGIYFEPLGLGDAYRESGMNMLPFRLGRVFGGVASRQASFFEGILAGWRTDQTQFWDLPTSPIAKAITVLVDSVLDPLRGRLYRFFYFLCEVWASVMMGQEANGADARSRR